MKKGVGVVLLLFLVSSLQAGGGRPLFGYTQVKYAFQLAPAFPQGGEKWMVGFEFHRQLNDVMALSFELMPYFRKNETLKTTTYASYCFVNLKGGYKPTERIGFYGGLGLGGLLGHNLVDVAEQRFARWALDWGWQYMVGVTIQFDSFSVLVEFHRISESLADLNEPNKRNHLMLGFGF